MNTLRREYRRESRRAFGIPLWKIVAIMGVSVVLWGGIGIGVWWAVRLLMLK